ncbi:MAG: type III pantothenate kinase [Burkholderiales bacterium]|nr:type III pantothenate kinase [Burkholderiales bacterium]
MLLLIDAGNTRIKWAVPDLRAQRSGPAPLWLQLDSVSHAEIAQLASQWQPLTLKRVLISNVAGAEIHNKLSTILAAAVPYIVPEWLASTEKLAGVLNTYRNPAQLGCDRFASAIAAHTLFPQQTLVVATCGTATTVDAVTADGVFLGGMILPGLQLMAQALARNTAQLPQVAASVAPENPFADNTELAIVSGCISAQVGAIARAVTALAQRQQQSVTCVLSGGAAPYLLPHLGFTCQHIDNLVLTGLYVVAQSVSH